MEAPKVIPKPKSSSKEENISFTYDDLVLEDSFSVENRKYLSFFVTCEKPFIMQCLRSEFLEYQNLMFDKLEEQKEVEGCECNICTRQFEKLDDYTEELELSSGTEELGKVTIVTPIYNVWKLVEGFRIGMCDLNNEDND